MEPSVGDFSSIFGFDDLDLQSNRAGDMSPRQVGRMQRVAVGRFWASTVPLATTAICVAAASWVGPAAGPATTVFKALLGLAALSVLLTAYLGWRTMCAIADAIDGRVEVDDGYVVFEDRTRRSGYQPAPRRYRFRTARRVYDVPAAARHALDKRQRYRIYFTPRAKALLAIEPYARRD